MLTLDSLIMNADFIPFGERQRIVSSLPFQLKDEKGRERIISCLDILIRNFRNPDLVEKINQIKNGIILITAMEDVTYGN